MASVEDTNCLCLCLLQWRTQEVHVYNRLPIYSIVGIILRRGITPTKTAARCCTLPSLRARGANIKKRDCSHHQRYIFLCELLLLKQSHVRKNPISSLILAVRGWAPRLHPSRRPAFHLPRFFCFEIFSRFADHWDISREVVKETERWGRQGGGGGGIRNSPHFESVPEPKSNVGESVVKRRRCLLCSRVKLSRVAPNRRQSWCIVGGFFLPAHRHRVCTSHSSVWNIDGGKINF